MFHPTSASQPKNSYELVGRRIKELIAAPGVKNKMALVVSRRKDENPEAWHQVIRDIEETSGVSIERLSDGTVRIGWRKYCD
ncbi:DUF1654 domain-containing protein [Pseudomonas sp. N3-W]|jgi:hypothetical protein|uniref:DUF1654 domain-containing protein n=1 Tax=Pseudomonas fungipugnans TaxID=3024217 RepID=A0ABT6QYJ1_9PSED|nr:MULTISPECIES: DUF1654 domain-containing protein [unclassified Pseudomonas]MDI2595364.1 DUF1654 domain-containing protein [Pseudomonas sp. 681]UWF51646.1 DUF1654 domain-containing protein [Pseudomonas sp. N3-W]